jgi:group I intron endonuclease
MKEKQNIRKTIDRFDLNHQIPAIYCFEHIPTAKKYIGSTNNLYRRMCEHFHDLNNKNHCNKHLYNYWNKYFDEFDISILEWLSTDDRIYSQERENFWIEFYQSYDKSKGFNLIKDPRIGGLNGFKHSDEARKKMSNSIKAFHKTPESIHTKRQAKINLEKIDKVKSANAARKRGKLYVGDANPFYGKTHSDKFKNKMSKTMTGKFVGNKNPNYGKKHDRKTIELMSINLKKLNKVSVTRHVVSYNGDYYYVINSKNLY